MILSEFIYIPGVIIMSILAFIFLVIALILLISKNASIIHFYHWKNVKEENKKAYAIHMGVGMLISALANFAGALINFFTESNWGWFSFGIGLIASLVYWSIIQNKYNGGFF